jgi:hypothetical protein
MYTNDGIRLIPERLLTSDDSLRVKNIDKLVSDIIDFMEAQYSLCFESSVSFILCR